MDSNTFIYAKNEIPSEDREALRHAVLTKTSPLGASFLELYGSQDKSLYQYLFDGHSKYLYEQPNERPSIIVGRKGAGKSTYLNNLSFKEKVVPISITQWKVMDEVQQIINALISNGHEIRAERSSYIWQWLLLSAVTLKSYDIISNDKSLKEFADFFPLKEFRKFGVAAITSFVRKKILALFEMQGGDQPELASIGWIIEDTTQAIDELEARLSKELEKKERIAIVLLDNEEDVLSKSQIYQDSNLQLAKEIAISGLLNLCGRANVGAVNVQIRYCIPAEQFFAFKQLAKTTGKDFSSLHLLHWSVGELLSMIAHRYLLYLYVWKEMEAELGDIYDDLVKIPIYDRKGAIRFFETILPGEVVIGKSHPEKSLTYLLRHFQILPRQLISLFNSILSFSIKERESLGKISEDILVQSVEKEELNMADEIIKAYEIMYPEAGEIRRKVLPNIPLLFKYRDLRKFYNGRSMINKGKDVLNSMRGKVIVSPDRFERCLIETGMIGRVISVPDGDAQGYINAEFEYSMPGSLDLCEEDNLVVHPIFCGHRLRSAKKGFGNKTIGVYPHDADPHTEPDRELIKRKFITN